MEEKKRERKGSERGYDVTRRPAMAHQSCLRVAKVSTTLCRLVGLSIEGDRARREKRRYWIMRKAPEMVVGELLGIAVPLGDKKGSHGATTTEQG